MASKIPYPGLRPFHREESDIFFGREEQTDALLRKLNSSRFLAVIGPSGCGKSSLVRAGMISALETGFMARAGARWRIAVMRPGNHPIRRLAEALISDDALRPEHVDKADAVGFLNSTLRRGPLGLIEALSETPLPERTNLLLVVDQFEEIFRFQREGDSDEADAFVALLLETAAHRDINVYVVITMRSDYLGDCAVFTGLPEAINEGLYLTPRMNRNQRHAAIVGPARVYGGDVDDDLVNRLLNETGADPRKLPVLQHLLMRMWECSRSGEIDTATNVQNIAISDDVSVEAIGHRLTIANYKKVGGIEGALSNHADEAFSVLDKEQQDIAEIMFRSLCECEPGHRYSRRPTSIEEISKLADATSEQVIGVVEVFRKPEYGFVVPALPERIYINTVVDISHESLIRQWKRLAEWVNAETKSIETYRFLEQTACRWKQGRAALWGTPDLENAEAWEFQEKPTPEWASRLGEHYDCAMEFLGASKVMRDAEKDKVEKERRREISQLRFRSGVYISLFLISAALAAWGWIERENAEWEKTKSFSSELALLAIDKLDENPELSTLLSWHAAYDMYSRGKEEKITKSVQESLYRVLDRSRMNGRLVGHHDSVLSTAFSNDNSLVATGGIDKKVIIWNAQTLNKIHTLSHDDWVTGLKFSEDNRYLISSTAEGRIFRWNIANQKRSELINVGEESSIIFSPDLMRVASVVEGSVKIWSTDAQKVERVILFPGDGYIDILRGVQFHQDGSAIFITSNDGTVWLTDDDSIPTKPYFKIPDQALSPKLVKLSPDGKYLAASRLDGTIKLWDIKSNKLWHTISHKKVQNIEFSADGNSMVTYSVDSKIRVWNVVTGEEVYTLHGHKGYIDLITFSPDGGLLASVSDNNDVILWNAKYGDFQRARRGVFSHDLSLIATVNRGVGVYQPKIMLRNINTDELTTLPQDICKSYEVDFNKVDITLTNDNKYLVLLSQDGYVITWDIKSQKSKCDRLTQETINFHSFSADKQYIAYASETTASVVDIQTGERSTLLSRNNDSEIISKVVFHPTNTALVAIAVQDSRTLLYRIELWDVALRKKADVFPEIRGHIKDIAFSSDNRYMVTIFAGKEQSHLLWDLRTGQPQALKGHENGVNGALFSRNNKYLVTFGKDQKAIVWDPDRFEKIDTLLGHNDSIKRVSFSPNNRYLATIGEDNAVKLWDIKSWRNIFTLALDKNINELAFSRDEKRLLIISDDNLISSYALEIEALINEIRMRVKRDDLTEDECHDYLEKDECPKVSYL